MPAPIENKLPKGSYAIAYVQKRNYNLISGTTHYMRYWVVRVESADRDGRVKTFTDNPITSAARKVDRFTTIYSLSPQYLQAAAKLYARQPLDFTGYADKEHLRLALVNVEARETLQEDDDDAIPACALAMGCLCAGHARGNPASAMCDTSEL